MVSQWSLFLVDVAVEASLRTLLIAVAVSAVLFTARQRSGVVGHAAYRAVLVAMLLMPVLPSMVPPVRIAVPSATTYTTAVLPSSAPAFVVAERSPAARSATPAIPPPRRPITP